MISPEFNRWEEDMEEVLMTHVNIDTFRELAPELAKITLPYFMEMPE